MATLPALIAVLAAGCAAPSAATGKAAVYVGATCRTGQPMMLAAIPGFVTMFRQDLPQAPGDRGVSNHPRWDMTQFVCGQGNGFVADDIMYGKYRVQDNALAQRLGYQVGKLPLLPYMGPAVSAVPRGVFESYEEALQFRSVKAAATWLNNARWAPAGPHHLTGLVLPAGFQATSSVLGRDDGQHEHEIEISGRIGSSVIVVSFGGGRELSWDNVRSIWTSAYERLSATSIMSRNTP